MKRILEILFVLMFILTGCGIDSIFEGKAFEWGVCFIILILVAWVLFGGRE